MVKQQSSNEPKPGKLSELNAGLLMLDLKREMAEAEYSAIGRVTFGHDVVKKRHIYLGEVKRVLRELKLTAALLREVADGKQIDDEDYAPEEIINFYVGTFLDLIHQLKDKLLKFIDYMAAEDTQKRRYDEPQEVSPASIFKKHGEVINKAGLRPLIEEWKQGTTSAEDGPIGQILRQRTAHHHRASRLHLSQDFQRSQMSRMALNPQTAKVLTEYGKQRMYELGEESYNALRDRAIADQRNALKTITTNLEAMAEKLIDYYKVPTDTAETAKIMADYMQFLASFDIKNEAALEKVPSNIKGMLDVIVADAARFGDQIIAIYLVGSCARKEDFIPGSSDINVYVITKNNSRTFEGKEPAVLTVLKEDEFLDEAHKKDRFICWSDGVLIAGKQFDFKREDFPKPGTLLTVLLNEGFAEKLEALKAEISALEKLSMMDLRLYNLKAARIMMDFDFGVAMANKPFYAASRRKKIDHTKEAFPGEARTRILEEVYFDKKILKQDDLLLVIDAFLASARVNYEKMLAVTREATEHKK